MNINLKPRYYIVIILVCAFIVLIATVWHIKTVKATAAAKQAQEDSAAKAKQARPAAAEREKQTAKAKQARPAAAEREKQDAAAKQARQAAAAKQARQAAAEREKQAAAAERKRQAAAERERQAAAERKRQAADVQNGYRKLPGMTMAAYGKVNKGGDYITYGGYCLVLEKNGSLRLYKGSSPYTNNKQIKWQYDSGKAPGEATLSWDENRNGGSFLIKLNGRIIWDAPKRNGKTLYTDKRRRSLILQSGIVSFRDGRNSYIWTAGAGIGPQGKFA